ncbi:MAG TPA: hypothetical protein VGP79_10400 [Bryobacteraceae bacterium]|nr:hypothetical protein [Bryobacteraceae bacterium]
MMTWLLRLVLPRGDRDAVLGDLIEERALQANSDRWYRQQVLRSIAAIVWMRIRRCLWLKTLGAALVGYLVVVVLVIANRVLMSVAPNATAYTIATLVADFGVMILGSYVAARMRPRAPITLAVITAVMGIVSLLQTGDRASREYQFFLIVVGPVGALIGGRIRAWQRRNA